jgi:hypothetical protein
MAQNNEIETQKIIQIINETKHWSLKKINKINESLSNLTRKTREKTQINKIIDEKWIS